MRNVLLLTSCLIGGTINPLKIIEAKVGEDITITLESNGSTGYQW